MRTTQTYRIGTTDLETIQQAAAAIDLKPSALVRLAALTTAQRILAAAQGVVTLDEPTVEETGSEQS